MPAVPPYSSMTTAMWFFLDRNSSSTSSIFLLSGTK